MITELMWATGLLVPLYLSYQFQRLWHRRFKKFAHLPQPPNTLIWGHVRVLYEQILKGAKDRHPDYYFQEIAESIGRPPIMVLDLWPFNEAIMIVMNHEVADQIVKPSKQYPYGVNKNPLSKSEIRPILGWRTMLNSEGEQWKSARRRYNPGFAHQNLLSLLPCILEKSSRFLEFLDGFTRTGETFSMANLATNLTMDIICAVVMDIDSSAQHLDPSNQSDLVKLFSELKESSAGDDKKLFSFVPSSFKKRQERIAARIDALLRGIILEKFELQRKDKSQAQSRTVLNLSFQGADALTEELILDTIDQLKTFLFAGHDTTSITMQWAYYELSRTPRALRALRKELSDVFGSDAANPKAVSRHFLENPETCLSKLSYTSAVIKETLRLYPPASTARMAAPGKDVVVRLPDGTTAHLNGDIIYIAHSHVQRDKAVYGESADEFRPERWLGEGADLRTSTMEGDGGDDVDGKGARTTKYPASAWRAFERGPRNCIGQELANIELRVILALTAARYDFVKVGLGELEVDEQGAPVLDEGGEQYRTKSVLYNTRKVTQLPVDGTMMKVKMAGAA